MNQKNFDFDTAGQTYHQFKVVKVTHISELQCILRELVHMPTGAHVMHIANEDPENLFCLSFQTIPANSNGEAHILEHTVLCGSKKYPIKDPFFSMTRRSLNTFMNALTGSDFTCYPASSQVHKDFYNLLEVYLDAVFKPLLNKFSFLQEGHRLEFSSPEDPQTPLVHKGIVYNEMKGALASGSARLAEAMNKALFPDLTYGYNSGGDPKDIPLLSYDELLEFHRRYYHPSRCLFFFYGNMPLEGHLDFIAKHALQDVTAASPLPELPLQPRFTKPHHEVLEYPVTVDEDTADKTMISFGWLTCHILQQEELLALTILEIILMDTDASPLKLALLKSGLCKQASIYMDGEISEVPIIIALKGCDPDSASALEQIIRDTLEHIVQVGIPNEMFERAVHQLEFAKCEIGGNHAPFGLSLFMRAALLFQHQGNPADGLIIHTLFEQLRRKHVSDPRYLTGLIRKHLLDNPHMVSITMVPSQEMSAKEAKAEAETLKEIKDSLSQKEQQEIVAQTAALVAFQKEQEDVDADVLPTITLADVPVDSREYPLSEEQCGTLKVFHHRCFTNEIVYVDLIFDLPAIAEQDLSLVRLFALVMPQIGCGGRSYIENLDYVQAHTGGIGVNLPFNIQVTDFNAYHPCFAIRGKALHREANKLFSILADMVTSLDFSDHDRLKEIMLKHYTQLQTTLPQQALRYGMNLAASGLSQPSHLANIWYGLDYYWMVKKIVENLDANIPELADRLNAMQQKLLGLKDPHLVLTCDRTIYAQLKSHRFYGLQDLPSRSYTPWNSEFPLRKVPSQGKLVAAPVASTCHIFKTIPSVHPDTPALALAACLLENLVLHPRIREQGGAYGGGASCNTSGGNFCFYSYRDPNINNTLKAFKESILTLVQGDFEDSDLEEAKLEIVQGLDAPVAPGSRGELAYLRLKEGKTHAVRAAFRARMLTATRRDVIEAVKKHILPHYDEGVSVIFAGRELFDKEHVALPISKA